MSTQDTTLPPPPGQERAAFEAFCFERGLMSASHGLVSVSSHCDTAWLAWQARAAIAAQAQQDAAVKESLTLEQAQQAQGVPAQCVHALKRIAEHRMSLYGNDDFFYLQRIAREALAAAPQAEPQPEQMAHIAQVAHNGGLIGLSEAEALTAIRKLSLKWWGSKGTLDEQKVKVRAAMAGIGTKGGDKP